MNMVQKKKNNTNNKNAEKKKIHLNINAGILHITSGTNNVILNFTDLNGNKIFQTSSGVEFKNSKKSTAFAFQRSLNTILERIRGCGIQYIHIKFHICSGRSSINVRDLISLDVSNSSLTVLSISDKKGLPHNGCRPPKQPKK